MGEISRGFCFLEPFFHLLDTSFYPMSFVADSPPGICRNFSSPPNQFRSSSKEGSFMESISNPAREAARARLAAAEAKREDILLYHIANGVNIESRTVEID